MACPVWSSTARSARIAPLTLANLKACPAQGAAPTTRGCGDGQASQPPDQAGAPGAGGDDQPAGLVGAALGPDAHALAAGRRRPVEDRLAGVDLGAERLGGEDVLDDAALGQQEAAVGLQDR